MRTVVLAALSIGLTAASVNPPPQRTFTAGVDVVRVDVLVTRGRTPATGLTTTDFELRDSGVLQQIDFVSYDEIPLNVVLVFDASASVAGTRQGHLRDASRAVFDGFRKGDRGALVTFGLAVVPTVELTANVAELQTRLDRTQPRGETSLIDGAFAGLMVAASDTGRSLMLVFSDGLDTISWLTADSVLDAAKRSDAVVYGVVADKTSGRSFIKDLATATGGDVVEISSTDNLATTFVQLLNVYRQRYLLGYVPRGVPKNGWHPVDVRVKPSGMTVKARPGYLTGDIPK